MEQYLLVLSYDIASRAEIKETEVFRKRLQDLVDRGEPVTNENVIGILNSLQVSISKDAINNLENNLGFTRCSDCECTVRNTWVRLFKDKDWDQISALVRDPTIANREIEDVTTLWNLVIQEYLRDFINGLFLTVIQTPVNNTRFVTCRTNITIGQVWGNLTHLQLLRTSI